MLSVNRAFPHRLNLIARKTRLSGSHVFGEYVWRAERPLLGRGTSSTGSPRL